MPEGLPPDASDLIDRLLQMDPQQRLGGGAELSEPADGRHATLLAHPFFSRARSGLQAQQKTAVSTDGLTAPSAGGMHRQLPPVPTLFELCVQPVCTQLTLCGWYKGGAAEGLPAAQWPEAVRRVAIFELKRKGALTDELRAVLLAGPTPPVIDDEALLATVRCRACGGGGVLSHAIAASRVRGCICVTAFAKTESNSRGGKIP